MPDLVDEVLDRWTLAFYLEHVDELQDIWDKLMLEKVDAEIAAINEESMPQVRTVTREELRRRREERRSKKPDAQEMLDFLDDLREKGWLGYRKWWVDYLFHFTEVHNAASILEDGYLRSRRDLRKHKIKFKDCASRKIIRKTRNKWKKYVRLYFRPLTPTTFHMEGFKTRGNRYQNAHCAVPVYILFDMRQVITLRKTRFSTGSLADKKSRIYRKATRLEKLDFHGIYDDNYSDNHWSTISARHAEVVYPKRLSLDYVKCIICRSQAEYETLRNLLSPKDWARWKSKIQINDSKALFNRDWLYVENVSLEANGVQFQLHLPAKGEPQGPYDFELILYSGQEHNLNSCEQRIEDISIELADSQLDWKFPESTVPKEYIVKLLIDRELAYIGRRHNE